MRSALPDMIALAKPEGGDSAKQELRPRKNRHRLAKNRVTGTDQLPDPPIDTLLPVTLQIQSKHNLSGEQKLEDPCEAGMNVVSDELTATVSMPEEEADYCEDRTKNLGRNVPFGLADLYAQGRQ